MQKLTSLSLVLFFISCTSFDKQDCRKANWGKFGYEDSLMGRPVKEYEKYVKDCSRYNIQVNIDEYSEQHTAGLKKYCTYDNGYHLGKTGAEYHKICTTDLEYGFMLGYERGLKEFNFEP